MKVLKTAIPAVIIVALTSLTPLAPSASGQSARPQDRARELTILSGRGGELGVRIADGASGGVEIREVDPDGAADKAGLKRGDIIVEFDGERVRSGRQLARLVQETPAGRTVKATITREGQRKDVEITPSEGRGTGLTGVIVNGDRVPDDFLRGRFGDLDRLRDMPFNFNFDHFGNFGRDIPRGMSGARLGVTVDDLTTQLGEYFGAKDGVLVTSVADGSAAAKAGVKAGDVITSINGGQITSREELLRALRDLETEDVTLGIVRDKKATTLKAKVEPLRRSFRSARPL